MKFLRALLVPTLALVAALIVGALVIIFTDPETLRAWASFTANPGRAISLSWTVASDAYIALFKGSFGSRYAISETLVTPPRCCSRDSPWDSRSVPALQHRW